MNTFSLEINCLVDENYKPFFQPKRPLYRSLTFSFFFCEDRRTYRFSKLYLIGRRMTFSNIVCIYLYIFIYLLVSLCTKSANWIISSFLYLVQAHPKSCTIFSGILSQMQRNILMLRLKLYYYWQPCVCSRSMLGLLSSEKVLRSIFSALPLSSIIFSHNTVLRPSWE